MPWKANKKAVGEGFRDLKYLPRGKAAWDCTLASLAFGARLAVSPQSCGLNAWAARQCLPASTRAASLGRQALVLWHGTSRARAERIISHGLFHKGGLWTTLDPFISHSYCRGRSGLCAAEGAVVCLVLDRRSIVEGRDFEIERPGSIYRFQHGLPPDSVEYVLFHDEVLHVGPSRARDPAPWPSAKFKSMGRRWVPVQTTPVRYSDTAAFFTLDEFVELTVSRLLDELGEVTAIEVFAALYSAVRPPEALEHHYVFEKIDSLRRPGPQRGSMRTLRAQASLSSGGRPAGE